MTKVYVASVRPFFMEENFNRGMALADQIRKDKVNACKQPQKKAASLAVGLLAEYAIKKAGICGRVIFDKNGKPRITGALEADPSLLSEKENLKKEVSCCISLSHSGDYVACVLSDRPVGVDIQKKEKVLSAVYERVFHPLERSVFTEDDFFILWTVKEAYGKITGQGISQDFRQLCLVPGSAKDRGTVQCLGDGKKALYQTEVIEDYVLAVCEKGEDPLKYDLVIPKELFE